jgi:hypothetical protein
MLLTDANNDTYLDANNNIAYALSNIEAVKQSCNNKLKTFLGEIFTDTSIGTDWFGIMLTDETTIATKNAEITRVLLSVEGVLSIDNIQYSQDIRTGEIIFVITLTCVYGTIQLKDLTLGV